jgi:DNA polymerase III sliding clamp (beta) subunit (PCNA family)
MNNEITLPLTEVKAALIGLGKVVSRTHSLPIVQSVRVARDKAGQVTLQTTDLDSFATFRLEKPQEPNPLTVIIPFKELAAVVKNSSGSESLGVEQITVNQAAIHYGPGQTRMQQKVDSLKPEEWPTLPEANGETILLPNGMRDALLQAMQCASHDPTRYVINGAFIDVSDKKLNYVVGTDGRHLFAANSFVLPLKESLIIPNTKFLNWPGFTQDGDWTLGVMGSKEKRIDIRFQSDHWEFTVKMTEGTFPNWKNVVPKPADMPTKIEFGPEAVELIKQVAPRMPGFDCVDQPIALSVKGDCLNLKAKKDAKDDWTVVPVPQVKITGESVTIRVNRTFLLKAMEFGLTELGVEDSLSAMRFRNGGRQMIVMPLRAEVPVPAQAQQKPPTTNPAPTTIPAREVKAPAVQPQPSTTTTTERKTTMPKSETTSSANDTALNKAIQQIEVTKEALKEVIHGLNDVLDTLKLAQKEHKTAEREMDSVRSTIKSLQKVSL